MQASVFGQVAMKGAFEKIAKQPRIGQEMSF